MQKIGFYILIVGAFVLWLSNFVQAGVYSCSENEIFTDGGSSGQPYEQYSPSWMEDNGRLDMSYMCPQVGYFYVDRGWVNGSLKYYEKRHCGCEPLACSVPDPRFQESGTTETGWECVQDSTGPSPDCDIIGTTVVDEGLCVPHVDSGNFVFGTAFWNASFYPDGTPIPSTITNVNFPGYDETGNFVAYELGENGTWKQCTYGSDGMAVCSPGVPDYFDVSGGSGTGDTLVFNDFNTDLDALNPAYIPNNNNTTTTTTDRGDGSTVTETVTTVKNPDGTTTTDTETVIDWGNGTTTTENSTSTSGGSTDPAQVALDDSGILSGLGDVQSSVDGLGGKLDSIGGEYSDPVPSSGTAPGDFDGSIDPSEYSTPDYDAFAAQVDSSPVHGYLTGSTIGLSDMSCSVTTQFQGQDIHFSICDWQSTFNGMGIVLVALAQVLALFIVFRGE